MSRFLETLCIRNNKIQHLSYHQNRLNFTLNQHFPAAPPEINLSQVIKLPHDLKANHTYKCRVLYEKEVSSIEFHAYNPKRIQNFQLVKGDHLSYEFKYANREPIQKLLVASTADEIIIVRNKKITDTSFSNIAFFNGNEWFTPGNPLLKGTSRCKLIEEGKIKTKEIAPIDLADFLYFKLINAMLKWEDSPLYPIQSINSNLVDVK